MYLKVPDDRRAPFGSAVLQNATGHKSGKNHFKSDILQVSKSNGPLIIYNTSSPTKVYKK